MGLPEKIELFECIVEVWQLGVAVAMLNRIEREPPPSIWCHSAFGLLSVMLSYFETIGKSLNPKSRASGTADRFQLGIFVMLLTSDSGFCRSFRNTTTSQIEARNAE